jgi:hypothetical protein
VRSSICPDASACPALLSTARLYGDRYRSNLWDHINALAAEPDNAGYQWLEALDFAPSGAAII